LQKNLELLLEENTFTITTAHQPNIFTGPLYFVYKILHVIKLAAYLSEALPENNFVPVFYMGSEDADLDELGNITLRNQPYKWETKQTGAVGRMKVDKAFVKLIEAMHGQLGVEPFGDKIISIFKKYYKEGTTILQATLGVVNELFGAFGLVVLIPDNSQLKRLFNPIVKKELSELFSHRKVDETLALLKEHYKVQAGGRELNLFYLTEDKRERIERTDSQFEIPGLKRVFTEEEILDELENHPERFSANVILRGVFQEAVLPNIAFIGGGGELAYWLELKKVFEAANVPYPVLILRNSFLLFSQKQQEKINELGFEMQDVFKEENVLLNELVRRTSEKKLDLDKELQISSSFYNNIKNIAGEIDPTLPQHVESLKIKATKQLTELAKKMLRAEKRKFEAEKRQIQKLKSQLFPNDNLQERVENVAGFYALAGTQFLKLCLQNSLTVQQQFTLLPLERL
jgi:bacillithiol biosynthesis cysteine-adding enzyme BshC